MNFLLIADRFIPENTRKDPFTYSRAKNIVGCSLILIPSGIAFTLLYVFLNLYTEIFLVLGGTLLYSLIPFMVRSGKSLDFLGGLAVFILWALFTSLSFVQGGLAASSIIWFAIIPVMASFLNGPRSGIVWVVLTCLTSGILQVLHMTGFQFHNNGFSPSEEIFLLGLSIPGAVLSTGLVTIASESMKKKAFEGMLKSQSETEAALKEQERLAVKLEEDKYKLRVSEEKVLEQKKYLSNSIELILKEMNRFSGGDLTVSLKNGQDDEIGKLFNGFNGSVARIRELVLNIQNAVQAAASTATELSSSSEELAAGAQEQSNQTMEVANAVAEVTKSIQQSAKYASQAAESSKLASQKARDGAGQVLWTKQGMEKIAGSAKETARIISSLTGKAGQIGEIVQVIDDIADQTNLLALNAAIEAARAGEQGRGFAVVADEVRKLAERTTKATKEIAQTIKAIQTEVKDADNSMNKAEGDVKEGMLLTEEVSEAFNQIIDANETVLKLVTQLAGESSNQTEAAEMISRNIEAIASVTGQSAAGTEQIAHASEDLNRLTLNLQELIARFRIEEGQGKEGQGTGDKRQEMGDRRYELRESWKVGK